MCVLLYHGLLMVVLSLKNVDKKKKKEINTKCNTSYSRKIHILNGSKPRKQCSLKVRQSLLSYFLNFFDTKNFEMH